MVEGHSLLKNVTQEAPTAGSVIDAGDVLFVRGPKDSVDRFVADYGLILEPDENHVRRNLRFYDIGLAEIVVLPDSAPSNAIAIKKEYISFRSSHP